MDAYHIPVPTSPSALASGQISGWARMESKSLTAADDLLQLAVPKSPRWQAGFLFAAALKVATWIGQHYFMDS